MSFRKNVALNWYFSMKYFLERFGRFWHRKLTLNVQIPWFLTPLCHLSVTDIKIHFATFDFFVTMKLVSTVWVSTSLNKSGYYLAPDQQKNLALKNELKHVSLQAKTVCSNGLESKLNWPCQKLLQYENIFEYIPGLSKVQKCQQTCITKGQ